MDHLRVYIMEHDCDSCKMPSMPFGPIHTVNGGPGLVADGDGHATQDAGVLAPTGGQNLRTPYVNWPMVAAHCVRV